MKLTLLSLALLASVVSADVYLHNPRGSNDRLDEANRDRNNGNRLFNSQNNDRGGYNVGSLYYYSGSKLSVEWTNQHSCGHENNNCQIIMQYMCADWVRDGTTTNTIPITAANCYNFDCDHDLQFGRHESLEYYFDCRRTTRNRGLFNANQNLNGNDCTYTRQNPNGNRNGLECPEERDFYPYWRPTPWVDVAILTNDTTTCTYYTTESQNVKDRYYCQLPRATITARDNAGQRGYIPITQTACEAPTLNGTWTRVPAWGVPAPACREAIYSRDNHLGNTFGGEHARFNWTIPSLPEALAPYREFCVFRLRYNISTTDYRDWNNNISLTDMKPKDANGNVILLPAADWRNNSAKTNPDPDADPAWVPIWEEFGLSYKEVNTSFTNPSEDPVDGSREYVFKNNPSVDIFNLTVSQGNAYGGFSLNRIKLTLAINTNQFARTFQDRSHTFSIREQPTSISSVCPVIWNLNVRGKRGNIVQVYPGVEYDYVSDRLVVATGDCIHPQWTGSNTNPRNNAGNGLEGTDRSNIVLLKGNTWPKEMFQWQYDLISSAPAGSARVAMQAAIDAFNGTDGLPIYGHWARSYPEHFSHKMIFPDTDLTRKFAIQDDNQMAAGSNQYLGGQYHGSVNQGDDAGTYFDLGPRKMTSVGHYYYLCTRNNDFSNRSQKGKFIVMNNPVSSEGVGWGGATLGDAGKGAVLTFPEALFSNQVIVNIMNLDSSAITSLSNVASNVLWASVTPVTSDQQVFTSSGSNNLWTLSMLYTPGNLETPSLMTGNGLNDGSYTVVGNAVSTVDANGQHWMVAQVPPPGTGSRRATDSGSVYFVVGTKNWVPIIAGVVGGIVLVALIIASVAYFRRNPHKWEATKRRAYNLQRSFASRV